MEKRSPQVERRNEVEIEETTPKRSYVSAPAISIIGARCFLALTCGLSPRHRPCRSRGRPAIAPTSFRACRRRRRRRSGSSRRASSRGVERDRVEHDSQRIGLVAQLGRRRDKSWQDGQGADFGRMTGAEWVTDFGQSFPCRRGGLGLRRFGSGRGGNTLLNRHRGARVARRLPQSRSDRRAERSSRRAPG